MLRVNDFQDNTDTNGTYGGNNGSTDDLLVRFPEAAILSCSRKQFFSNF